MSGLQRNQGLRPVSAKRAAELAAEGVTVIWSTLNRAPGRGQKSRSAKRVGAATGLVKPPLDPTAETVATIWGRALGSCELCGRRLVWQQRGEAFGWSVQHRISRGAGGTSRPELNLPANLLVLCGSGTTMCHGRVESDRTWAEDEGLGSLPKKADPAAEPVHLADGWWLLDNAGDRRAA